MSSDDSEGDNLSVGPPDSEPGAGSTRFNFTTTEKALLLTLVEERKSIIEDKRTNFGPKNRKTKAWLEITEQFNANAGVNKKTRVQLKNCWTNSKNRAKKAVTHRKKEVRKTGGGPRPKPLSNETESIMRIVPMQLQPLNNPYDCDAELDLPGEVDIFTVNEIEEAQVIDMDLGREQTETPSQKTTESTVPFNMKRPVKQKRDPRSSLIDLEYNEHQIRMKTLQVEYEEALLKKEMTSLQKVHQLKLNEVELRKAELELEKLISN